MKLKTFRQLTGWPKEELGAMTLGEVAGLIGLYGMRLVVRIKMPGARRWTEICFPAP